MIHGDGGFLQRRGPNREGEMNHKALWALIEPRLKRTGKSESRLSVAELVDLIEGSAAERKDMLRWLKLARFGTLASAKGSLRHDRNVEKVSGCSDSWKKSPITSNSKYLAAGNEPA